MQIQNDGNHISKIIDVTTCKKHKATAGMACWHLYISAAQRYAPAVCGPRIKRAGFIGKISPSSLSLRKPPGQSPAKHRKG